MKTNIFILQKQNFITLTAIIVIALLSLVIQANAADGDLDLTYGTNGKVMQGFSGFDQGTSMALQADGKTVVAGLISDADHFFYTAIGAARYNADGSVDTTFGINGYFLSDVYALYSDRTSVVIQPDGKIIVGGTKADGLSQADYAILRLNPNGALDSSFGTNGKVIADLFGSNDIANKLLLQADGKIVAIGGSFDPNSLEGGFSLARFDTTGNLDPTFGDGGKAFAHFAGVDEFAYDAAFQADGKIVAVGYTHDIGFYETALARFDANGALDQTFGVGGKVTNDFLGADEARAVAIQTDGKIVTAGRIGDSTVTDDFLVLRYETNLAL